MVEASLLADGVGGGGEIVLDTIFNANPYRIYTMPTLLSQLGIRDGFEG